MTRSISGFLNINKEKGLSSSAVVQRVKKIIHLSCGHMGTLDPLAEGVLPIAFGNATRLFSYLLNKQKVYRAVFAFGVQTDTDDCTGKVLKQNQYIPTLEEIQQTFSAFIGQYDQIPPIYSAKSINGVRAYTLARKGESVPLKAKMVLIYKLICTRQIDKNKFEFLIVCGGGTYIRAIGRDIAKMCNTYAIMTELVREKCGFFDIKNAIKLEELTPESYKQYVIPPESTFEMQSLNFDDEDANKLKHGLKLPIKEVGEYKLYLNDNFYGIAVCDGQFVKAKVKLV